MLVEFPTMLELVSVTTSLANAWISVSRNLSGLCPETKGTTQ